MGVRQWLQFQDCMLAGDKSLVNLKLLNQGLEDRVYLAGEKVSVADYIIFYSLQDVMRGLTFQERENIVHVTRFRALADGAWRDERKHHAQQNHTLLVFSIQP